MFTKRQNAVEQFKTDNTCLHMDIKNFYKEILILPEPLQFISSRFDFLFLFPQSLSFLRAWTNE